MSTEGPGRLIDAVVCARDLQQLVPPDSAGQVQVQPALQMHVRKVRSLDVGQDFPVLVRKSTLNVEVMRGMLLRYKTRALIHYSDKLNGCWSRFVICKELAHLLADTPAQFAADPIDQLQQAQQSSFPLRSRHDTLNSEEYAFVLAAEYMLSWPHRPRLADATRPSNYKVALRFRMPEKIVEWWYSSGYAALSEGMNDDLDAAALSAASAQASAPAS